jgi:hypothetical protein
MNLVIFVRYAFISYYSRLLQIGLVKGGKQSGSTNDVDEKRHAASCRTR